MVANHVIGQLGGGESIYKSTEAMTQTWRDSNLLHLYLLVNIEQDCAISLIIVNTDEQYTIPANTYYIEDDWNDRNYVGYGIAFFAGNSPLVRTVNLKIPNGGSILIKNMNVRAEYE